MHIEIDTDKLKKAQTRVAELPYWAKGALLGLLVALLPTLGYLTILILIGAVIGLIYGKAKEKPSAPNSVKPPESVA